ncbi:ATP-grasp domain-containing protein [Streptomyces abikoensis]|uniref:ATP-grasp domain-containing protein n=1 Tax=Streptomyces abikoensis TaxID=97398 RepID=A0ABW7TD73_9ACTN
MHIILVEASRPCGFDYIEELAAAGIEVTFLTENLRGYADTRGFARHELAARVIEVPGLRHREDLAASVREQLGPHSPDGVLCVRDEFLVAAACLARDLGLPHEPVSTVRLLRDKAAVRERLTGAGVGTLRWRRAETAEQALEAADAVGYPVVVKPVAGHGSIGVSVLWNRQQAARTLTEARGGGPLLVEQFKAGREVAAQVLVQDGRTHLYGFGERLPSPVHQTVELGGYFPAQFEQRGAARRFVTEVVRALDVRNSALHIELLITPTGPELIEVNGRIAGYAIPRQMRRALDRSITLDLLNLCIDRPVAPMSEPVSHVALRSLLCDTAGTARAVDPAPRLPAEVVDHWVSVRPGDQVVATTRNAERFGYVMAEGNTPSEAHRGAGEAMGRLRAGILIAPTEDTADRSAVGDGTTAKRDVSGPHVVLLLGSHPSGPRPERVLDAIGGATGHVTVLWCGPRDPDPDLRELWGRRYAGTWHSVDGYGSAVRVLDDARAEHPVQAVVTFTSELHPLKDRLDAVLRGADGAVVTRQSEIPPQHGPGCLVLCLVHNGLVQHLQAMEQLPDDEGHRTLRTLPAAAEAIATALARSAERAVLDAGITSGIVRCLFPNGAGAGESVSAPIAVLRGLDEGTHALHDATHATDIVSLAVAAALGDPSPCPVPPTGAAVFRALAAPSDPFRVTAATPVTDLLDHPELVSARTELSAGSVWPHDERIFWLRYTVAGQDLSDCRDVVARVESGLVFRHAPLGRKHVVILDRVGKETWTRRDGSPLLPADRFRVSVLSGSPGVRRNGAGNVDFAAAVEVFDHGATAEIVTALHHNHPIGRIAAASERLLAPAAALRSRLALPGDSPQFTRGVLDKAEMKRLAARAGVTHAEGRVLYDAADAYELLGTHGAIVVKPRSLSGSQGVAICHDREQLNQWLRAQFVPGQFLAERKVSGPMCHIDAVVHGSVVAWDVSLYQQDSLAYTRGEPWSSQTVAEPALREQARSLLEQVISGWSIRAAVLHMEAFVENRQLVFCEVAGRPGGAGIIPAFRATQGIDLRHAKILIDAGEDPRTLLEEPAARHAGWTVHYSPGGVLVGFDDSAVTGRTYHRTVRAAIGDRTAASAFSGTGLSTHVFAGNSSAEVSDLVTIAEREIRITVHPDSSSPAQN